MLQTFPGMLSQNQQVTVMVHLWIPRKLKGKVVLCERFKSNNVAEAGGVGDIMPSINLDDVAPFLSLFQ